MAEKKRPMSSSDLKVLILYPQLFNIASPAKNIFSKNVNQDEDSGKKKIRGEHEAGGTKQVCVFFT